MFRRNRVGDKEKENRATERQVRQLAGRDTNRKTFGFKCAPDIPVTLKKEADELHVPLFALAEHCLQLGAIQLRLALGDPQEAEELRRHLVEDHIQRRTVEKVARYDEEAAAWLDKERRRRYDIDRAARAIVARFVSRFDPARVEEIIDLGTRTKVAMINGAPAPPPIPGFGYRPPSHRAPQPKPEGKAPETPDSEAGDTED